ncbi:TNFAIP3-interacting protein 3 [Ahaetulla prasina]|uniref:TNFAIP3-interacting protein 3 n=1 Tax=Ahaetulla prasina TaxID=499056 RepID=UPI002646FD98|nr:TNFAIP3-interacting protein 3 [Ahaetulla prasina]
MAGEGIGAALPLPPPPVTAATIHFHQEMLFTAEKLIDWYHSYTAMQEDNLQVKTRCESLKKKFVDMHNSQSSDSERCDSVELDDKIRILIRKNDTPESCKKPEDSSCALNRIFTKNLTDTPLQQKIISLEKQKQELLSVNYQWDQHFRQMKQYYEKKITEMKEKLETVQKIVRDLEQERYKTQEECKRLGDFLRSQLAQEMKDKNTLKKENRFLKQETTLTSTKNILYKCEINRLNKSLLDILKHQNASSQSSHVEALDRNCNQEEMGMQIELLKEQVQIYEEDFKKERSDRERLSEEKELLQKLNEQSQSQLKKLTSQIKHYQTENEFLQKQVKQQAQGFQALTEKHFSLQQLLIPSCLNCGNCGLLQPFREPRITLGSCGANRKQQQPL